MNTQTAAAASSTSDSVTQIGRELVSNWCQTWRNKDEAAIVEAHSPEATRLGHQEMHLSDRRYALEAMAAEIQAGSLEGAMVQIMLAHAEADMMASSTEESNERQMRTISKLLYSALIALERAAGVSREEVAGEAYMRRNLDPHALVVEATEGKAA